MARKKTDGAPAGARKSMNLEEFLDAKFGKIKIALMIVLIFLGCMVFVMSRLTVALYHGPYEQSTSAARLAESLNSLENDLSVGIITYDMDETRRRMDDILEKEEIINEMFDKVESFVDDEQLKMVKEAHEKYNGTVEPLAECRELLSTIDPETGENYWSEATDIFDESISGPFLEIIDSMGQLQVYLAEKAQSFYNMTIIITVLMMLIVLAVVIVFYFAFHRTTHGILSTLLVPMKQVNEAQAKLANGDLTAHVDYDDEDELGDIGRSTNHVVEVLGKLLEEAETIAKGAVEGQLGVRGDVTKFDGAYSQLIAGFNGALDALVGPLNIAADAMNDIGKGEIPEPISTEMKGDFVNIANSINACINTINTLVADTGYITKAAEVGDIKKRANAAVHSGAFADIIGGVNASMDVMTEHIDNIPIPVTIVNKEGHVLFMNKATLEIAGFAGQENVDLDAIAIPPTAGAVAKEAIATGEKCTRKASEELGGLHRDVIYTATPITDSHGNVVAAFILAMDETEIVAAMKKAEENAARDARRAAYLAEEVDIVIDNLDKLADGNLNLNTTMEDVDEELSDIAANFRRINDNLEKTIGAISAMIEDAGKMSRAAVEGRLEERSDISQHSGRYADVMKGFNDTFDAVADSVHGILEVLKRMAEGDLKVRMQGSYQGSYNEIKEALNTTGNNMQTTVAEISQILSGIGNGNLNQTVSGQYKGDFVEIHDSLESILTSLNQIMNKINESSRGVAQSSKEVAGASQTLSESSTQQASAVQQLTATVSDVDNQTKQNAEAANEASDLSHTAEQSARLGNERMAEMMVSMKEIDEASQSISKVIKVIDDIAFQTNILALNAAVEAARAGVHGKGFAVVADEVRSLAAKSAEAAGETAALIEGSVDKTAKGTKIASETAEALKEIFAAVEKSAGLVKDIAQASEQQSVSIGQINKALEQVAKGVQANSATSEESAAASEELYGQASMLKELVDTFKLRDGNSSAQASAVRALPAAPAPSASEPPLIVLDDFGDDKY